MSKSIDNLKLSELLELKTATDLIGERYACQLIKCNANVISDQLYKELNASEREIYNKRIKINELSNKISNQIDFIVTQYL